MSMCGDPDFQTLVENSKKLEEQQNSSSVGLLLSDNAEKNNYIINDNNNIINDNKNNINVPVPSEENDPVNESTEELELGKLTPTVSALCEQPDYNKITAISAKNVHD